MSKLSAGAGAVLDKVVNVVQKGVPEISQGFSPSREQGVHHFHCKKQEKNKDVSKQGCCSVLMFGMSQMKKLPQYCGGWCCFGEDKVVLKQSKMNL